MDAARNPVAEWDEFDWLRERLRLHTDVLDQLPDGVLVFDNELKVAYANKAACLQFKYSRKDLLDLPVSELVPEASRQAHAEKVGGFNEHPKARLMGSLSAPLSGRDSKGRIFPCDIALGKVHSPAGTYTVAVVRTMLYR